MVEFYRCLRAIAAARYEDGLVIPSVTGSLSNEMLGQE